MHLLLLLVLSAGDAAAATLERIRERGTVTLAYRADAAPYSFRTARGEPAGYMVDVCREVAAAIQESLGGDIRIAYHLVAAEGRFEAVRSGTADLLCDPSSITLARREIVDFSLPTFLDGASVMFRDSQPIERYEDLAGRRVGVLRGTTTEAVLRTALAQLGIAVEITTVGDHRDGIDLLAADRLDAYFGDRAILASFLRREGLPGFRIGRHYFSYETYAIALPRDDSAFRLLVDRTLARLYRSGRIRALLVRTFGTMQPDEMLQSLFIIHALPER